VTGWFQDAGSGATLLALLVVPVLVALGILLLYVLFAPLLQKIPAFAIGTPAEPVPSLPAPPRTARRPALPTVADVIGDSTEPLRRIAVALELGPADGPVLDHVLAMRRSADTEVTLIHIAESAASRYLGEESSDQEARQDEAMLETVAERLREYGIRTRVVLGHGEVSPKLAEIVNQVNAELLVTGAHGHRLIGDLVLGSTTSSVRHLVSCPVLTVRARAKE
jgi:manganese transport protein